MDGPLVVPRLCPFTAPVSSPPQPPHQAGRRGPISSLDASTLPSVRDGRLERIGIKLFAEEFFPVCRPGLPAAVCPKIRLDVIAALLIDSQLVGARWFSLRFDGSIGISRHLLY